MNELDKLILENQALKDEVLSLKNRIERYREIEVELSTTIDGLREGFLE